MDSTLHQCNGRHPEDVVRPVLVRVFGISPFAHFGEQLLMPLLGGVGDVFQKISPSTTCLYSAASMLLRSLSAVSQSLASKPRLAAVSAVVFALPMAIGISRRSELKAVRTRLGGVEHKRRPLTQPPTERMRHLQSKPDRRRCPRIDATVSV